jgi:DNA-binding response OmpR family regulator
MIHGRERTVLVIGASAQAERVVDALRRRGLEAWSDESSHVAADRVSLEWADAVVLIDPGAAVGEEGLHLLRQSSGPAVLLTSALLDPDARAELFASGIDVIDAWPGSPEVVAARVARLLNQRAMGGQGDVNGGAEGVA